MNGKIYCTDQAGSSSIQLPLIVCNCPLQCNRITNAFHAVLSKSNSVRSMFSLAQLETPQQRANAEWTGKRLFNKSVVSNNCSMQVISFSAYIAAVAIININFNAMINMRCIDLLTPSFRWRQFHIHEIEMWNVISKSHQLFIDLQRCARGSMTIPTDTSISFNWPRHTTELTFVIRHPHQHVRC